MALKSDGTVLAWGPNANGQLGDGTTIQRLTPVQVSGLGAGSGVIAIAAGGGGFSLALKWDGTVLAWGLNANGRLGDGTTIQRLTPVQVSGLGPGSDVTAIAAGNGYSLALKADGTVLAWGLNANGQLGDGTTLQRLTPVQVSGLGTGSGVVALAAGAGGGHSLALKADGTVLSWGLNATGQLGDGTTIQRLMPVQVSGLGAGSGVVAIAAGGHSLALMADGSVLAWGGNSLGQLGDGTTTTRLTPVQVSGLGSGGGVVALATVNVHSLALRADGTVLAWGANSVGQLGDGTLESRLAPVQVSALGPGSDVVAVAVGGVQSLAVKADGTVLAWGGNAGGQLGDGTDPINLTLVQVTALGSGSGIVAAAAGNGHSLALKADGTVLAWGANGAGQLGDGTTATRLTPVQVSGLGSGSGIVALAAGNSHSLALKADGTVLAWGANAAGQLGDGTTATRLTPVQVSGLGSGSGIVALAAGNNHNLALKSDGTVLAWGVNANGQLGDGTTAQRLTPVQVSGLGFGSGVVALDAGSAHSLALKWDGTVLAWGGNASGPLGDGTTTQKIAPIQVSGLGPGSGVMALDARSGYSLALKSDGTVLAWGFNANGQLGDGTTTQKLTPVQVSGLGPASSVVALAAGALSAHSLALKSDGTVLAWGGNGSAQLGDGTTLQRLTPVQVRNPSDPSGFLTGAVALAVGAAHNLAIKSDQDHDGIEDGADNCPLVTNPDQTDTDGDGAGDVCDLDDDNDGVADGSDNCQFTPNPEQENNDGDAQGDACDSDDDNDVVPDAIDNCPFVANPDQRDTDQDGIGDVCDETPGNTCAAVEAEGSFQVGRVNFAIEAEYEGGPRPRGDVSYNDRNASQRLGSTQLTSLIIDGAKVWIRGTGTVNNGPTVSFRLYLNRSARTFSITWADYSKEGTFRGGVEIERNNCDDDDDDDNDEGGPL